MKVSPKKRTSSFVLYSLIIFLLFVNVITASNYLRRAVYVTGRNILEKKILYTVDGDGVRSTEDFIIRYHMEDEEYVDMILDSAYEYYEDLKKSFSYEKKNPIYIIVYSDVEEMKKKLKLSSDMNPMGLYYGRVLNILSPKAWIQEKDLESMKQVFRKEGPMVHELTHLFIDEMAMGNYPTWFTEGMALYMEKKYMGYEWGLYRDIDTSEVTIKNLTNHFEDIDEFAAYKKSIEIIESWVELYGEEKVMLLLKYLEQGFTLEQAVDREFHISLDEI